jgi:hypothetical protein
VEEGCLIFFHSIQHVIGRVKTSHEWARQNQQVYKAGTGINVGLF